MPSATCTSARMSPGRNRVPGAFRFAKSWCASSFTERFTRSAGTIPRARGGPDRRCGGARSATWRRSRDGDAAVVHCAAPRRAADAVGGAARLCRGIGCRSSAGPRGRRFRWRAGGHPLPPASRGPPLVARPRRGGRRRCGGMVGVVAGAEPDSPGARHQHGVGRRRPPSSAARGGGAGADRAGAARGEIHPHAVRAAAAPRGVGRRADAAGAEGAADASHRCGRARHAARCLFACRHDGGRGDDATDRRGRGGFVRLTGRSGGDAPQFRARQAARVRRPSRCRVGRRVRKGCPRRERQRPAIRGTR